MTIGIQSGQCYAVRQCDARGVQRCSHRAINKESLGIGIAQHVDQLGWCCARSQGCYRRTGTQNTKKHGDVLGACGGANGNRLFWRHAVSLQRSRDSVNHLVECGVIDPTLAINNCC